MRVEPVKKKNGMLCTIIFYIGAVLIDVHRGGDESHTPCCFVLPLSDELWKLNQQHDIYQRLGSSCFLDQVSLCTTDPWLMWGHVHADVLWPPRTQVSAPLKLRLGCLDFLLAFACCNHSYFLHPATCLNTWALLQIKVHQAMLGIWSKEEKELS